MMCYPFWIWKKESKKNSIASNASSAEEEDRLSVSDLEDRANQLAAIDVRELLEDECVSDNENGTTKELVLSTSRLSIDSIDPLAVNEVNSREKPALPPSWNF